LQHRNHSRLSFSLSLYLISRKRTRQILSWLQVDRKEDATPKVIAQVARGKGLAAHAMIRLPRRLCKIFLKNDDIDDAKTNEDIGNAEEEVNVTAVSVIRRDDAL